MRAKVRRYIDTTVEQVWHVEVPDDMDVHGWREVDAVAFDEHVVEQGYLVSEDWDESDGDVRTQILDPFMPRGR